MRPNVFANVTRQELRNGTVTMANLMDQTQTELPTLSNEELMGITLGPLSVDCTSGYVTAYQEEDVIAIQQGNYVDLANFHQLASQVPRNVPCYIFRQVNPPINYDPVRFGPWEPVNILLLPELPSKHTASKEYKIALMYVPTSLPIRGNNNWMGYRQYSAARIKMICCGPSTARCCPVGARTVSPCSHSATCLYIGCCLAADPNQYRSTHSTLNMLDPGSRLPMQHHVDLIAGSIS